MLAMSKDLEHVELVNKWANQWLVTINAIKTVFMLFSTKGPTLNLPPLGSSYLTQLFSHSYRHFGLISAPKLTRREHIQSIIAKIHWIYPIIVHDIHNITQLQRQPLLTAL